MEANIVVRCGIIFEVRSMARDGEYGYWSKLTGDPDWQNVWSDWVFIHDLSTDVASAVHLDCVEALTPGGEQLVNEAWQDLCDTLGLDSQREYDSFDSMMRLSVQE